MSYIAEEGFRQRGANDTAGFYCARCWYRSPLVAMQCPSCGGFQTFAPVTSPEQYHDQTKQIGESKQVQHFSPGFDSTSLDSQRGKMMLPDQLFYIIRQAISGLAVKPMMNLHLGRQLYGLYAPIHCKPEDEQHLSEDERKSKLQFVCACEMKAMPEWDIITKNSEGEPTGLVRGWRSVLGIFYRKGLIPWVPDDGRRQSAWTIRNSPMQSN